MKQSCLDDVMNEKFAPLAYGKRRLLEIAMALAYRPRVVLLDHEPQANNGNHLQGGEQPMLAVARAGAEPEAAAAQRATRRPRADIVEELLRAVARVVRDEGMSAIIVEQNPRMTLPVTQREVVLDRGVVVHEGASDALMADRERLDRWLRVGKHRAWACRRVP